MRARWNDLIAEKIAELLEEADVIDMPRVAWDLTSGRHVNRAMKYMREHLSEIMMIAEVAQAYGVSTRTLEHAFKAALQMRSMQVLNSFRLEEARALLLDRNEDLTVTEVALACGFGHLGRFSSGCRDRFGELPSHTLAHR